MLIDVVDITVTAGHGGRGKVSFGRMMGSGPDGGNGGRGGDVYLGVTSDLKALIQFSKNKHLIAENGIPGKSKRQAGADGQDLNLLLPIGTHVTDLDTLHEFELRDLNQRVLICRGGLGGRGNFEFKSSTNRSPDFAQPGLPGEEKHLHLNLKLIAKYGLIGLPNAGKSSLLNELTNANATVGAYPFTTLEPNLGVFNHSVIADIPGLIAGASKGRGLGVKFLKHIDKVSTLLHCIAADSSDVVSDYQIVSQELFAFKPELAARHRLILLTKTDLVDQAAVAHQMSRLKQFNHPVLPVSIHDLASLETLAKSLT